jgi:hypothetical protein
MGLTLALQFVFPDLFRGVPFLVFSRLRQGHVNTVLFAFLSGGMMGLWLYIVPRLAGRQLWSEVLGNISVILWNLAVLVGVVGLLTAHTQSREYAEFVWVVDVGVMIVLILNMFNLYMTIANRTEPKLYVSMWYVIGTLVWMPLLYFIGNVMWNPPTGALTGINDTIFNWFYGHNVLGFWFTTGLLPVIYYIVPKETRTPLYSHVLSLIAFWGIAFFYTGVGAHHLGPHPLLAQDHRRGGEHRHGAAGCGLHDEHLSYHAGQLEPLQPGRPDRMGADDPPARTLRGIHRPHPVSGGLSHVRPAAGLADLAGCRSPGGQGDLRRLLPDLPRLCRQRPGELRRDARCDASQLWSGALPQHARRGVVLARVGGVTRHGDAYLA